jgi:hypothetical protein
MKGIQNKYQIFVSLNEDINSGWVWINKPPLTHLSLELAKTAQLMH